MTATWPQGIRCLNPSCPGVIWPQPMSRLEEGLGHEKGKCDKCGSVWKATPGEMSVRKRKTK